MRYKRKILEIEAVQITSSNLNSLGIGTYRFANEGVYYFSTPDAKIIDVKIGDFICTDIEGGKYPCKQSVFEKIWERVENDVR